MCIDNSYPLAENSGPKAPCFQNNQKCKLAILDGVAVNPGDTSWEAFSRYAQVTVFPRTNKLQTIEHIGNSDAILLNKVLIDKTVLDACPALRYIGVLATGYNVIDTMATREAGVTVTNIPSYSTQAVAQHTFALILHFSNKVTLHNQSVQKGDWANTPDFCYHLSDSVGSIFELAGKTLGILGYGRIGRAVAQIACAFGMKVLATPRVKGSVEETALIKEAPLSKMLSESDIVSLHAPLTFETKRIIDGDAIAKMKKGAILINTARGGLICEKDIKRALEAGKLAAYACDVLETEPMSGSCLLGGVRNCVITPHMAWLALQTRQRLLDVALENFHAWLEGKALNVVSE